MRIFKGWNNFEPYFVIEEYYKEKIKNVKRFGSDYKNLKRVYKNFSENDL